MSSHITRPIAARLAGNRWGRMLMHLGCLVARPSRLRWHWRGMVREFGADGL